MRLRTITVTSCRSFAGPQELELRPLTLLYGKNNAGKSALLRLLPILSDSVDPGATAPFDLAGPAGGEAAFEEYLWREEEHKQLTVELGWDTSGGCVSDRFELRWLAEPDREEVIVYRWSVARDGSPLFEARALPHVQQDRFEVIRGGEDAVETTLSFRSLMPAASAAVPEVEGLRARLQTLVHSVQWLASVRARPDTLITKPGGTPVRLSPDGREAPEVLLSSKAILHRVAAWFRAEPNLRELDFEEVRHPRYRMLLSPRDAAFKVDLAATGAGMAQVLPVLTALEMARDAEAPRFVAIEEPQAQLHGNAQRALARHLAHLAASEPAPCVLIETHSRILMLGVQLAIALGELPKDRVIAYWVDQEAGRSTAHPVTFDAQGRPETGWPASAFSEDQALARELLQLQTASSAGSPTNSDVLSAADSAGASLSGCAKGVTKTIGSRVSTGAGPRVR